MPVQKFRSFEDARHALWLPSGSPEAVKALQSLLDTFHRWRRPQFPVGVFKVRSIEEANEARRQWIRASPRWK